ncbi:AI-2E family transporter [Legionella sp. 16cNR16C]|uniref:AI-2E family transporter n=1 Tax=Legionella sp. 16cNR16C TaxID=2905656 RepID=UPI001E417B73|nr:AI-2E family transporter [Legionella sp. 16cNR16C]MCE3045608.1 AI-2E family transporter [Legionella sp. 16cNR16C]
MPENRISTKITPHLYLLLATVIAILLIWHTIDIFLLAFAGILVAIIIRSLSQLVSKYSKLPPYITVTVILIAIISLFTGVGLIVAPSVSKQISQLYTDIPEAWNKFNNDFFQYLNISTNTTTSQALDLPKTLAKVQNVPSKVGTIFTSTFGFIANIFVILFFGIALAYQPEIYTNGLINLFSKKRQRKIKEILNDTTETLQYWLAGKAFSMLIIGLLTWAGLWLLDIPLAFTLALFAALLSFIPNIGPIFSAIPAILLALLKSPMFALYVALLYVVIQTIESYLITPLIQQKSISLPAALIVFTQLIMSILVGILGLTLATPLLAVISVVVKHTYLSED